MTNPSASAIVEKMVLHATADAMRLAAPFSAAVRRRLIPFSEATCPPVKDAVDKAILLLTRTKA